MDQEPSSTPTLADKTLQRLHGLAEGNGIDPQSITVLGATEQIYTLEGTMTLLPYCEVQGTQYAGPPPRGKERKLFQNFMQVRSEAQKLQEQFKTRQDWIVSAVDELKMAPGEGWGLDGATITFTGRDKVILAATEACGICRGQKLVVCVTCHGQGGTVCQQCGGRGQEPCYHCNGSGGEPGQPGHRCNVCSGVRFAPCRRCHGTGKEICPTCQGRRGTPCPTCKATGQITEEAVVTFGATTKFHLKGEGLPSGLRRGLDRVGISNLAKGHADITREELKIEKTHDAEAPPDPEDKEDEGPQPFVNYKAMLPYADIRVAFGDRKALISAFGKRCALMGVPPFLDDALLPWREKLKQAVLNGNLIEAAGEARAIREALTLVLIGKGNEKELRRHYPVGLSQEVTFEITSNVKRAVNGLTWRLRGVVAAGCAVLSAGLFAGLFATPWHVRLLQLLSRPVIIGADVMVLIVALALSWLALSTVARMTLLRRFPGIAIPVRQRTGKTGIIMMALIVIAYIAVVILTPCPGLSELPFLAARCSKLN